MARCLLCDRNLGTEYIYQIPQLSASQGSGQEPITVCASCNWYFDGTTTGLTEAMRDAFTPVPICGSFRELPKDRMLWFLASACEATAAGGSLSGWFTQIRNALSGGGINPV